MSFILKTSSVCLSLMLCRESALCKSEICIFICHGETMDGEFYVMAYQVRSICSIVFFPFRLGFPENCSLCLSKRLSFKDNMMLGYYRYFVCLSLYFIWKS
ncbi:hypothetical protein Ancab_015089 [Ancistrocladus abbreviatus]